MCTFVTLIAETDDVERLNAILAGFNAVGYRREAERVERPQSQRTLLAPAEQEYWLVRSPCDCGCFLGHALPRGEKAGDDSAAEVARYRRKGWSEARIARALADRNLSRERPDPRKPNEDASYWIGLLTAIAEGLALKRVGLMHADYSKSPRTEFKGAGRRDAGSITMAASALENMDDGVIHDFKPGA